VLRIPNVVGDKLTLDDLAYVDLRPVDVSRLALRDGDLLLVRTNGNPNYVGRSAVFRRPDDRTWVYASYLIRVRLSGELLPDYVNVFLGSERGRRELLRRVTTSAGNHNINSNSIRLLSIPVPDDIKIQNAVVRLAEASDRVRQGGGNWGSDSYVERPDWMQITPKATGQALGRATAELAGWALLQGRRGEFERPFPDVAPRMPHCRGLARSRRQARK